MMTKKELIDIIVKSGYFQEKWGFDPTKALNRFSKVGHVLEVFQMDRKGEIKLTEEKRNYCIKYLGIVE